MDTERFSIDEQAPEPEMISGHILGSRGTLASLRPGSADAWPSVTRIEQAGKPSIKQARLALIERSVRWLEVELGITRLSLLRFLNGTLDIEAELDEPAPDRSHGAPQQAELVAEAKALARRKGRTKAELAERQEKARQLLRENPHLAGAEVARLAQLGRQLVTRLAREMHPAGRAIRHSDGRVCVRGGRRAS